MTHPAVIAQALLVKSADDAHYQVGYSPVPVAMYNQAVAIQGDKLYMFGGYNPTNGNLATMYEYDIATNTWTQKASYVANYSANITFSSQTGKLHIIGCYTSSGGNSNHVTWDPLTNTYGSGGPTSPFGTTNISNGALFELSDPSLLYLDAGSFSSPSGLQVYDLTAGTWTAKANSGISGGNHSVINGVYHKAMYTGYTRKYNADTNTWEVLPSTPVTLSASTGADYNGRFAVLCRRPGGGQEAVGSFYILDESSGTWLLGPRLPDGYGCGGARVAPKDSGGSVWLLGGHSNNPHDKVIRIFPKSVKDKAAENLQSFVHAF